MTDWRAASIFVTCTRCGAGIGSGCVDWRSGVGVQPHPERLELGARRLVARASARGGRPPERGRRCGYTGHPCECDGACALDVRREVLSPRAGRPEGRGRPPIVGD